ncbi:MAG: ABC transporter permease [Candidatus Aenigmarchaeota archaeon]|nr:ABC transporter permease [Candidatus Aenigmarchaeota archaeon]
MKANIAFGVLALLVAWGLAASAGLVDSFFLPGSLETFQELGDLLAGGEIGDDIALTLGRIAAAFSIAAAIGLPAGLALGMQPSLFERLEFLVDFFRSIPATALFPLFLLVFGISDSSKIAVAAFSSALIILFNTAYGVRHAKKARLQAARLMGANRRQLTSIIFWESLPQTLVGMRTAVSLSIIVIVVTEMFIGTSAGIGRLIVDFQYVYNVPGMYAAIFLAGVIGYLANLAFALLEKRVVHWAGR